MSDYTAKVRSNYFKVKDQDAWQAFCDRHDLTNIMIWDKERQINLYGFMDESVGEGLPTHVYDPKKDEHVETDFPAELAKHLEEDEVAIIIEIGNQKLAYLGGYAIAVNAEGTKVTVSTHDIIDLAEGLGKNVTMPED